MAHRKRKKRKRSQLKSPRYRLHIVPFIMGMGIGLCIVGVVFFLQQDWSGAQNIVPLRLETDTITHQSHIPRVKKSALIRGVILHGTRNKKKIALTFDADMNEYMRSLLQSGSVQSYYDPEITRILNLTQTEATFFLTGMWIELYPDVSKALAINPLIELANHSYSHPSFDGYCYGLRQIEDIQDAEQVRKTQALLKKLGVNNHYFRFPGGCYSENDVKIVNSEGMEIVHWDDSGWDGNSSAEAIENSVISQAQDGSIIVLHLNGPPNAPHTAEALPTIIDTLKKRGFAFVKISELLGEK